MEQQIERSKVVVRWIVAAVLLAAVAYLNTRGEIAVPWATVVALTAMLGGLNLAYWAILRRGAPVWLKYVTTATDLGLISALVAFTGGSGVHVILDMVGGSYIPRELDCLAPEGRLVLIAFLGGTRAEVDFRGVLQRWLTITGSTLRPRSVEEKGRIARVLRERVWPLVESGSVRPVVHATIPLADAAAAHRMLEAGAHVGKIVLVA